MVFSNNFKIAKVLLLLAKVLLLVTTSLLFLLGTYTLRGYIPYVLATSNETNDEKYILEENIEFGKLEHWRPDWYNQSDIGLVLYNRLRSIKKRCANYDGVKNEWKAEPKIRLVRSLHLQYCHTAKAGSTFWRHLIQASNRIERSSTDSPQDRGALIRVTTMRNPWHRLVSTYIQKLGTKYRSELRTELRMFCPPSVKKKPSFKEFVKRCVLGLRKRKIFNIHWLPTTERCNICNGHYDYIIGVENMAAESYYVLKQAGQRRPEKTFNETREDTIRNNEKSKSSSSYQSYYAGMDVEDIKGLQDLYAFDIYVLQYPKTPFVDFSNS